MRFDGNKTKLEGFFFVGGWRLGLFSFQNPFVEERKENNKYE
jgi:hypothetical protein